MGRLGLGLGLAAGARRPAAGAAYDPAAEACFAAMATQPAPGRKALLGRLIAGLKADGVWAKLDWLSLFAAHDAQAARLNLVDPSRAFGLINTPAFTADRGYAGVAASASCLDSGWDAVTDGVRYGANAAHMGVWVNGGATANTGNLIGARASATQSGGRLNCRNGAGNIVAGANTLPFNSAAVETGAGFTAWDRSTGDAGQVFKDGAAVFAFAFAAAERPDWDFYACGYNDTGGAPVTLSEARIAACCWGGHLADAEHLALYGRLHAYLAALGAA